MKPVTWNAILFSVTVGSMIFDHQHVIQSTELRHKVII